MTTVVIGVGSPLMGDDGLGLAALAGLRAAVRWAPPVEYVDGGTWGMNLLPAIESADRLIMLDAIDTGAAPGALTVLEHDELPGFFATKLSPHQIDLKEVIAAAQLRGTLPVDTVALGLQPDRVELRSDLSPAVRERLPSLVEAACDRLQRWGHARVSRGEGQPDA